MDPRFRDGWVVAFEEALIMLPFPPRPTKIHLLHFISDILVGSYVLARASTYHEHP